MDPSTSSSTVCEHDVSLETIRSWWKVPAIAHFCSLFRSTFKLPDFEIEELEENLYQDSESDISRFLVDLLTALLKGSFETQDIDDSNYSDYVTDICNIHWEKENRVNPLNNEDNCFQSLSTLMKVEILYTLCDYRLDANDVSILKDYDGTALRVEPLGHDAKGTTYWYFYGTRLYREDVPPPRPPKAKQKKRKKRKKRCFLQALREKLAISQSLISEDEESIPEPPTKKPKGKNVKSLDKKEIKGSEKRTSNGRGRKASGKKGGESANDEEDDDVPLAKMASPPKKKTTKGEPVPGKGMTKTPKKESSPKKSTRSIGVSKGKPKNGKDEKKLDSKKNETGKKLTKNEGKDGQRGKSKRNGHRSESDEGISLADMQRSKVNGQNKRVKRSSSNTPAGRGRRRVEKEESSDEEEAPPAKKSKVMPAAVSLPVWSNKEESSSSSESSSSEDDPEPAKWQVICETEEDWLKLTENFKKSKITCEQELYQVLAENFLPEIHSLFVAKERDLRRKLQDLAPKRSSSRIAVNKSKQEEEEKVKAIQNYEKDQRHKAEALSRREFRHAVRQRKELDEGMEQKVIDREMRVNNRSHSSAKYKKRKYYKGFKKVLETVKQHPDAWPFVDPVQESFAPAYYDIIQHPMDIRTVEVKVQEEMYRSKAKFEADMELIFSNCVEYNGPESEYTMMGANVASCFQEALDLHFPPGTVSDGELSDITSDQDSAYCLSYPRELRRRSMALNYTEMESTSDSGDTGRDEDDDDEKTVAPHVFPSYLAEKSVQLKIPSSPVDDSVYSFPDNEDLDGIFSENQNEKSKTKEAGDFSNIDKSETKIGKSPNGSKSPRQRKGVSVGKNGSVLSSPVTMSGKELAKRSPTGRKKKQKESPSKDKGNESPTKNKRNERPSKKGPSHLDKANKEKAFEMQTDSVKKSCIREVDNIENRFSKLPDNASISELTSLQRLEAITDRLGTSYNKTGSTAEVRTHDTPSQSVPVERCAPSSTEDQTSTTSTSKQEEQSNETHPVSSPAVYSTPAIKIKSETSENYCSVSHDIPAKTNWPQVGKPLVGSPLVVPSSLATVYNPGATSEPLTTPSMHHHSASHSNSIPASTKFQPTFTSTSAVHSPYLSLVGAQYGAVSSPQIGDGDASRATGGFRPAVSSHFSAFHSVGKDIGLIRPRLNSVEIQQTSIPSQLTQTPPQFGILSQENTKGLTFGKFPSPDGGFGSHQASTSKLLADSSSVFQSSKPFPSQPTIVRPVSRYPVHAQAIRQNQYLLQSGAITNQAANAMPQLNILQIASAPSLTLNIQPSGLLNSSSIVNVAPNRPAVPSLYGQNIGVVNSHLPQNSFQQKPTLLVQYQGTPGETPAYSAQFQTNYQ